MTIADDIASVWKGVGSKPTNDKAKYYSDLLRRVMLSKRMVEESGRKYSVLPMLRDLTRKTMVRVPAEKVEFLEVTVFDLIANPLKKNLQPYVSEFNDADVPLVVWFTRHAKKEPSLAFDVKTLEAWLETRKPEKPAEAEGPVGKGEAGGTGEKGEAEKENQPQPGGSKKGQKEAANTEQPESPSALEEKGVQKEAGEENATPGEAEALDGEEQENPDAPEETGTKEEKGTGQKNPGAQDGNRAPKEPSEEPPGFLEEEAEDLLARELTEDELERDG